MNYSRRPNRPDANVYRDMRRRGLGQRSSGRSGPRRGGNFGGIVIVVIVAGAMVVGWMMMR